MEQYSRPANQNAKAMLYHESVFLLSRSLISVGMSLSEQNGEKKFAAAQTEVVIEVVQTAESVVTVI
jgi:hypothetical protein